LPSHRPEPALHAVPGGVLSLRGPALQDLLRAVLARGASIRFRAKGTSMHPFIRDGDVVTVSPLVGSGPRTGDVVAFCHPETGRLVLHRIVAKQEGGYLIRGDNCPEADGVISSDTLLGIVSRTERCGSQVTLGRGPERLVIAFLSHRGWLQPLVARTRQGILAVRGCR
jgi:signal peptidase I